MNDCYKEDIFIVCKETNFNTNQVVVYDVGFVDKNNLRIPFLQLRERYNINLKYYAILIIEGEIKWKRKRIGLLH